jgi:hypothetical protein
MLDDEGASPADDEAVETRQLAGCGHRGIEQTSRRPL